jgi:hypothetical protein
MDKSKFKNIFKVETEEWKDSLNKVLPLIK